MTPENFIGGYIHDHEGKLSLDPADNGNWFDPARLASGLPQRRGGGTLVGSQYGVTAYALAAYTGKAVITAADIRAITPDLAIKVGLALFVARPGFGKLPWNRVTASIIDKGWGSGTGTVAKMMQTMVGADPDAAIGPKTVAAFTAFIAAKGEEGTARLWCAARKAKDLAIATNEGPDDPDAKYLNGWNKRSESFLPGTRWWTTWGAAA